MDGFKGLGGKNCEGGGYVLDPGNLTERMSLQEVTTAGQEIIWQIKVCENTIIHFFLWKSKEIF